MSSDVPEEAPAPVPQLSVRDAVVTHAGFAVGEYVDRRLVLNLGWCRLAGLSLTVQDDPDQDNHREGVVLRRTYPPRP